MEQNQERTPPPEQGQGWARSQVYRHLSSLGRRRVWRQLLEAQEAQPDTALTDQMGKTPAQAVLSSEAKSAADRSPATTEAERQQRIRETFDTLQAAVSRAPAPEPARQAVLGLPSVETISAAEQQILEPAPQPGAVLPSAVQVSEAVHRAPAAIQEPETASPTAIRVSESELQAVLAAQVLRLCEYLWEAAELVLATSPQAAKPWVLAVIEARTLLLSVERQARSGDHRDG